MALRVNVRRHAFLRVIVRPGTGVLWPELLDLCPMAGGGRSGDVPGQL